MDSNTIRPRVSPRKSHKKIKVLRRPKVTVSSFISINDGLTNKEPNESHPSVDITPTLITPSKPYLRHAKLTHRTNPIYYTISIIDRLDYINSIVQ